MLKEIATTTNNLYDEKQQTDNYISEIIHNVIIICTFTTLNYDQMSYF